MVPSKGITHVHMKKHEKEVAISLKPVSAKNAVNSINSFKESASLKINFEDRTITKNYKSNYNLNTEFRKSPMTLSDQGCENVLVRTSNPTLVHISAPSTTSPTPSHSSIISSLVEKSSPISSQDIEKIVANGIPKQSSSNLSIFKNRQYLQIESLSSTKSSFYDKSSSSIAIKFLLSNNMAGSIIGRNGVTIAHLQQQSSARIKLSQSRDCFPGTTDRVCLVYGPIGSTKLATSLILKKLYNSRPLFTDIQHSCVEAYGLAKVDVQHNISEIRKENISSPKINIDRSFSISIRLLVPVHACGMIIGRGGSNIKAMTTFSGVSSVRLSPKNGKLFGSIPLTTATSVVTTSERIVTITGDQLSNCIVCLHLILDDMERNPDTCRYANMTTSYTKTNYSHSIATAPFTSGDTGTLLTDHSSLSLFQEKKMNMTHPHFYGSSLDSRVETIPQEKKTSHTAHISHQQNSEAVDASIKSNSVSLFENGYHVTLSSPNSSHITSVSYEIPEDSLLSLQNLDLLDESNKSSFGGSFNRNSRNRTIKSLSNEIRQLDIAADPVEETFRRNNKNSQVSAIQGCNLHSIQIGLSENIIGSILGKAGRTLKEIQLRSSTNIRIS